MADTERLVARVRSPLAAHARGFHEELRRQGYTALTAKGWMTVMAHLSRWLQEQGLEAGGLTPDCAARYCNARRLAGYSTCRRPRSLDPLLRFLRAQEVIPEVSVREPVTAEEQLLARYHDYLAQERSLVPAVVANWDCCARLFVTELPGLSGTGPDVTAASLTSLLARELPRRGKNLAAALRSFLRFLYLDGRIEMPLAQAVPAVAGWKGASLPRWVAPDQVACLLGRCDRRTAVGRRDHAVLVCLARLGLRVGEVAAMRLDDIDWHAGEIIVRGKGGTQERLPLPSDVGEAIAGYLRQGRPRTQIRTVFLSVRAPIAGMRTSAIRTVVYRGCARAGIRRLSAHQLRHSAATAMLEAGASLPEVGQVLRHRRLETTAMYAKVNHVALRALALPWPGEVA